MKVSSSKRKRPRRDGSQKLHTKTTTARKNSAGMNADVPPNALAADPSQLAHNNTYSALPRFYVDKTIQCRQCGTEEVWSAARQKWWYEVAKGNIFTQAVLCRACRKKDGERKVEARRIHLEGIARKRARVKT